MSSPRVKSRIALVLLAACLCGCESNAAGTLFTVSDSAIAGTGAIYFLGKLDFSTNATFAESRKAVIDGFTDLGLHEVDEKISGKRANQTCHRLVDDDGNETKIFVVRRTPKLNDVRIDVGWFGSATEARLLMERIRAHLPATVSLTPAK